VLAAEERPACVDREHVLPDLERGSRRVLRRADPGHVHEHVEPRRDRRDGVLVAHVDHARLGPFAQLGRERVEPRGVHVGEDDVGPFGMEEPGGGLADSRRGARHERPLPREPRRHGRNLRP
jgi:hypothetical protein